jgi:hypothetical protein
LATSNPAHPGDNVNRRTSDSNTVRRRSDKAGIHRIWFTGIVSVLESIEMPGSSRQNSHSAPIPANAHTTPGGQALPIVATAKAPKPRSATANSKAIIFQLRNRPILSESSAGDALGAVVGSEMGDALCRTITGHVKMDFCTWGP